ERESRLKYGSGWPQIEFTHFFVNDPIEELLIVARFPHDFLLEPKPLPFVAKLRPVNETFPFTWESEPSIETQLQQANALRYIESLKIAALRVRRPEVGYSYGIQWRLPPSSPSATGQKSGQIEDVLNRPLHFRKNPSGEQKDFLLIFL